MHRSEIGKPSSGYCLSASMRQSEWSESSDGDGDSPAVGRFAATIRPSAAIPIALHAAITTVAAC